MGRGAIQAMADGSEGRSGKYSEWRLSRKSGSEGSSAGTGSGEGKWILGGAEEVMGEEMEGKSIGGMSDSSSGVARGFCPSSGLVCGGGGSSGASNVTRLAKGFLGDWRASVGRSASSISVRPSSMFAFFKSRSISDGLRAAMRSSLSCSISSADMVASRFLFSSSILRLPVSSR